MPQRGRQRMWAKQSVNTLFAWYNFVTLGCPDTIGDAHEPQAGYTPVAKVRPFAENLLGEYASFGTREVRSGGLDFEGARAYLQDLLVELDKHDINYTDGPRARSDAGMSNALAVDAARVAIPEHAGTVDPLNHLPPERAKVLADLSKLRLPEELWPPVPLSCHRVPECEEDHLARRLLDSGMAVLMREDKLPCTRSGELLLGGLFCVPKNTTEDRLIYDRRKENITMRRLRWAELPSGACFARMLLKPWEYLRGSGDDLRNFYYCLRLPENWVRYNAFGRRVSSSVVNKYGGDPQAHHRLCLRVLGMGDLNACCIAQATHEHILQGHGLLHPSQHLRYGKVTPSADVWQGVYLDDLLVTRKCSHPQGDFIQTGFVPPEPQDEDPDILLMRAAEQAYEEAGLTRAAHKAFRGQHQFKAWGAAVDGIRGRVSAPLLLRQQTWRLISLVVKVGWITQKALQKIIGYVCFAFQFRRELYCLLHHTYNFVDRLPEDGWARVPANIIDELRSIAYHLPLAFWSMRRQVSKSLLATDATPTSGGAVRCEVSERLATELFRRGESRGAPVRLDGSFEPAFASQTYQKEKGWPQINELGRVLDWRVTASYSFRQTSHINLQELRALRREVMKMSSTGRPLHVVQNILCDSQVAVGAVSKGRSSSYKLNGVLRGMLPYLVVPDIAMSLIYINTHCNPADFPSRFAPLPAPDPLPDWLKALGMNRPTPAGRGWEIFAGSARLTVAHREAGVDMLPPIEKSQGSDAFDPRIDEAIAKKEVDWIWLAPPRSSFSHMRHPATNRPPRPQGFPEGDETVSEIWLENTLWRRALALAEAAHKQGIYFVIEHPRNSKAWQLADTQRLLHLPGVRAVPVDLCVFSNEGELPRRQATRLLSSCPWLPTIGKLCGQAHTHGLPSRSTAAAAYPREFCIQLARACKGFWDGPIA